MNQFITARNRSFIVLTGIIILMFAYWKNSYSFFWRDEWFFLRDFRDFDAGYFFRAFNGHIKPIFKLAYCAEVFAFGINTNFYQYVDLLVYSIGVFGAYKIFSRQSLPGRAPYNLTTAVFFTFLLLVHALNFNHLLWSFQLCQSLFMTFQAFSIYFFIKYIDTSSRKDLLYSLLFLLLQNYSFGNGLFFSTIFIGYALLFRRKDRKLLLIYPVLLGVILLIQAKFGMAGQHSFSSIMHDWKTILVRYFQFLDINVCRTFFLIDALHYRLKVFGLAILAGIILFAYRSRTANKERVTIYLLWILSNSIAIPMARDIESIAIPHYYSVMTLLPMLLLVYEIVHPYVTGFWQRRTQLSIVIVLAIAAGSYLLDNRMVSVFTLRSVRDEYALRMSIKDNVKYYSFDDPIFTHELYFVPEIKDVYLYWKAHTRYRFSAPLENE